MRTIINSIQYAFAGLGGFLGYFLGGFDGFLYALVIFVIADYFTGVLAAAVTKKLSSEIGFRGIARKVTVFILIGIGNIIDKELITTGSVIRTAVIFFYLSNEGISILENAAVIGLPIPEKLKQTLLQLKDEDTSPGSDDTDGK